MTLWLVGVLVFLLNLPFGYWRAAQKKFSWQWFVFIHAPVPLVVLLRLGTGLMWKSIPPLALCFFAGQFSGAWLRHWLS